MYYTCTCEGLEACSGNVQGRVSLLVHFVISVLLNSFFIAKKFQEVV